MMTGEEDNEEADIDLPSAPNSRIKMMEPQFEIARERAPSKIEKKRPVMAI